MPRQVLKPVRSWKERKLKYKQVDGNTVKLTIGTSAGYLETKFSSQHPHALTFNPPNDKGRTCDSCSENAFGSWHCEKCDYDVCGHCMQDFVSEEYAREVNMKKNPKFLARDFYRYFPQEKIPNSHIPNLTTFSKLISTPEASIKTWIETEGKKPENFDHAALKRVVISVLKKKCSIDMEFKVNGNGISFKQSPVAFDPIFEREVESDNNNDDEEENKKNKKNITINNTKSKKTKSAAKKEKKNKRTKKKPAKAKQKKNTNPTPSTDSGSDLEIVEKPVTKEKKKGNKRGEKRKAKNHPKRKKPKRECYNLDWSLDATTLASQMFEKGWRIKTSNQGGKKVYHFIPPKEVK